MEIYVQGTGSSFVKPNEVRLALTFVATDNRYEDVLRKGVESVDTFVKEILLPHQFTVEDLKTSSFVIREDQKYNEQTRSYEKHGYQYNQYALLKFDYDKELLARLMEEISKLETPPAYQVHFGVKEEKKVKKQVLKKAYQDAYEQALAIAEASQKQLKDCRKVDFQPTTDLCLSPMKMERNVKMGSVDSAFQQIANTFTPEDIKVQETLYCVWLTD